MSKQEENYKHEQDMHGRWVEGSRGQDMHVHVGWVEGTQGQWQPEGLQHADHGYVLQELYSCLASQYLLI